MVTVPSLELDIYWPVMATVPSMELDIYRPVMVTVPSVELDKYLPLMATVPSVELCIYWQVIVTVPSIELDISDFLKKYHFFGQKISKILCQALALYAFIICQVIIRTKYYTNASLISAPVVILYQNVRGA